MRTCPRCPRCQSTRKRLRGVFFTSRCGRCWPGRCRAGRGRGPASWCGCPRCPGGCPRCPGGCPRSVPDGLNSCDRLRTHADLSPLPPLPKHPEKASRGVLHVEVRALLAGSVPGWSRSRACPAGAGSVAVCGPCRLHAGREEPIMKNQVLQTIKNIANQLLTQSIRLTPAHHSRFRDSSQAFAAPSKSPRESTL